MTKINTFLTFIFSLVVSSNQAFANPKGQPYEWQIGFQEAASPLMQELINLHDLVFWIITVITLFVFF